MTILNLFGNIVKSANILGSKNADNIKIYHRRNMHIFDSLMYADIDEEGFDTFEEHPGVLSNIECALCKACKTKLQEILDESKNGEIPLKLKI